LSHLQSCRVFHPWPFVSQLLHVLLAFFWHHGGLNWNEPSAANAHMNRFKPQRSQWTGNGSLSAAQITSDETAGFGFRMQSGSSWEHIYWMYVYTHMYTHTHTRTHTQTHTHTHTRWFLWFTGTFHRRNVFYTVQTVCAIALHLPYT